MKRAFVGFENLAVICIIGCLDPERIEKQKIFVDLRLELEFSQDRIDKTIDYMQLIQRIEALATTGQFYLIEALACSIVESLLAEFGQILSVWVKVKKPTAIPQADFSYAECEKKR